MKNLFIPNFKKVPLLPKKIAPDDDLLKPKRIAHPPEVEDARLREVMTQAFIDGNLLYESPITIMRQQIDIETCDDIVKAICSYGIHIDKDQLIKALAYDRAQYRKGFEDGRKSMAEALRVLDLECKYCVHSCKAPEGDCIQADYDCFVCTKDCPCRACRNNSNWEFDNERRWVT